MDLKKAGKVMITLKQNSLHFEEKMSLKLTWRFKSTISVFYKSPHAEHQYYKKVL